MTKYYNIDLDGFNGYEYWEYTIDTITVEEMLEDVRQGLEKLGGGHADIWDTDTGELYEEIEV